MEGDQGDRPHRPLILVVDDDDEVRAVAVEALQEAGYQVLEAPTGHRAVVLLDAHPDIDLLFTDIVMPGIDGYKLADMAVFRRPGIKILYTTGYARHAETVLGVVHGPMLRKPYRPAEMMALVREAVA